MKSKKASFTHNSKKLVICLAAFSFIMLMLFSLYIFDITSIIKYELMSMENIVINLEPVNQQVRLLAADPSSKFVMRVAVKDSSGMPVSKAHVRLSAGTFGDINPSDIRTDKNGEYLVTYTPPSVSTDIIRNKNIEVTITAELSKSNISSSFTVDLTGTPVILVHGYQCNGTIFENLKEYLDSRHFQASALDYESEKGVAKSAKQLEDFIQSQKLEYLKEGLLVNKFDIIAHSMGGLVTRYYTCSEEYIKNSDVRKIIFISVPHKGSPLAPLGLQFYNDAGIKDLVPDNNLLIYKLPSMINKGLNNTIQVGNIVGQYDEVVTSESASLEEWNIETGMYNVGENNFTMDKLLNGKIIEAANHKAILNNKKVFEKIEEMLETNLPYPIRK